MENYQIVEKLGNGAFGLVHKVKRLTDGKILARKEIDYSKMSEKEKQQLVSEVNILRELQHENIVRYYERWVDKENQKIYIIMEYCDGGDLSTLIEKIKKQGKMFNESFIWNAFSQIVLALDALHNPPPVTGQLKRPAVIHRDLKPGNIFLMNDKTMKLGDFGLSRLLENPFYSFAQTYVGTPLYMSPEIVSDLAYNAKSDIWSLGCLLYELCTLETPFQAQTHEQLAMKIKLGNPPHIPTFFSKDLNNLIRSMLQLNPNLRPSTSDLLKVDKIRQSIKERDIRRMQRDFLRREEEINRRELLISNKENSLRQKELELQRREQEIERKEQELRAKLLALSQTNSAMSTTSMSTNETCESASAPVNKFRPYRSDIPPPAPKGKKIGLTLSSGSDGLTSFQHMAPSTPCSKVN